MKHFSVVICTYGRHNLIEQCLKNILDNTKIPQKIILIDQNINFLTYNRALNFLKKKNYKHYVYIRNLTKKGLTKSKNISLKYVKTKYVFFIDDDILIEKNFFSKNIELIFKKKAHAVSGVISNYDNKKFRDFIYNLFNHNIYRDNRFFFKNYRKLYKRNFQDTFQVPGGITCYDTKIFKKVLFDEKYITHNYEDVEFNIRLRKFLKKPKLLINMRSLAYDRLSNNVKQNFNSRIYFMTLLYLKNKSFQNLIFYLLSLSGFIISCISTIKLKNLINIKTMLKKAILKSKN